MDIAHSSQFLSALLISSCLCEETMNIEVVGTHGMAYIDMTRKMMEQFGVETSASMTSVDVNDTSPRHADTGSTRTESAHAHTVFTTPAGQSYHALDYQIEPDLSAACYFYAMAALLDISVTVRHVAADSMQGDLKFLDLLVQMGCTRADTPEGICITGPADGQLKGITADLSAFSDQAITLAAIAPFADAPTTITGIGHIRFQESDRIHAIVTELSKMGIRCTEKEDSITIYPGVPAPCIVETYEDHRMAMGFSLVGLRCPVFRSAIPNAVAKPLKIILRY